VWSGGLAVWLTRVCRSTHTEKCRENFISQGAYGALTVGNGIVLGLFMFSKFTAIGRRLTWHPYALLGTAAYVAPFWIRGEAAVIECQRASFEERKRAVERANQELFAKNAQ
jgi:hypothetical protein